MQTIQATFQDDYDEGTHLWVIVDNVCEGKMLFNDYLAYGDSTPVLKLCSDDGIYAAVTYQRTADGAPTVVDTITDQSIVFMD